MGVAYSGETMGLNFHIGLPGPFTYSARVSPRIRRAPASGHAEPDPANKGNAETVREGFWALVVLLAIAWGTLHWPTITVTLCVVGLVSWVCLKLVLRRSAAAGGPARVAGPRRPA